MRTSCREGSTIADGNWWEPGYSGPPLVSFDADSGPGLGLKVGDTITVNVLGRNVEAKIANFRKIDWESLAINFVMVFSPNTLTGAPHRVLVTLEYPKGTDPAREAKLVQALADRFPLVTAIKVGDIVEAAKDLLEKVMTAIRMTAGVTLLIGALVLAGAVAATQQRRKYQAVLYKTLGATRGRIVRAELLEFALLGAAVAAFALAAGVLTAWALCKWAFEVKFVFSGVAAAETVLLALALVLGVGAIATWRVLSAKAAPYLRGEYAFQVKREAREVRTTSIHSAPPREGAFWSPQEQCGGVVATLYTTSLHAMMLLQDERNMNKSTRRWRVWATCR